MHFDQNKQLIKSMIQQRTKHGYGQICGTIPNRNPSWLPCALVSHQTSCHAATLGWDIANCRWNMLKHHEIWRNMSQNTPCRMISIHHATISSHEHQPPLTTHFPFANGSLATASSLFRLWIRFFFTVGLPNAVEARVVQTRHGAAWKATMQNLPTKPLRLWTTLRKGLWRGPCACAWMKHDEMMYANNSFQCVWLDAKKTRDERDPHNYPNSFGNAFFTKCMWYRRLVAVSSTDWVFHVYASYELLGGFKS